MKPSGVLNWKSLAAKIHPPLPLTPRESQKLLSLLTGSFRTHLDNEFSTGSSISTLSPSKSPKENKHLPTDAHIRSILSSTLLKSPASGKRQLDSKDFVSGVGKAQSLLSDPLKHFQSQVAAGQATLDSARYCLDAYQHNLDTFRGASANGSGSDQAQATRVVLSWLLTSGLGESHEFIHEDKFMKSLIPLLIKENKVEYVWKWFGRLRKSLSSETPEVSQDSFRLMGKLLKYLTYARITSQSTINDALKDLLSACKSIETTPIDHVYQVLHPSTVLLSRFLLQHPTTEIDPTLYRKYMAFSEVWCKEYTISVVMARMSLFGPDPDPLKALQYFEKLYEKHNSKVYLELQMALRTAQMLFDINDTHSTKWMLKRIQKRFPNETKELMQQAANAKTESSHRASPSSSSEWSPGLVRYT